MPDTDPTGQGYYRDEPVGTTQLNPLRCTVVATYSTTGPVWTVSSDRRTHPGAAVAVAGAGDYDVSGLVRGTNYLVTGCEILPPTGTLVTGIKANVRAASLDAAAGTLSIDTRRTDSGALAAPSDGTELHLTIMVETLEDAQNF